MFKKIVLQRKDLIFIVIIFTVDIGIQIKMELLDFPIHHQKINGIKQRKRKENGKEKKKKYELSFEVASERKKITGYTLIPAPDCNAEAQHMKEHEAFQKIQRHAFNGDIQAVKELLLEFPVFKREDLKEMLIRSPAERGKTLEL